MSFRNWTKQLRSIHGDQPLWPWLLGMMLDQEFERLATVDEAYVGDVFKDRDAHDATEGTTERCLVASLYHLCLSENQGCLLFDSEPIWLLGYEWPNQGGNQERGRRADLVGLRLDGGLVVFECKRADNSDPPVTAVVEGLDYLACLLRRQNFEKVTSGFFAWVGREDKRVPNGFEDVVPTQSAQPSLVVMAPEEYFRGRYSRSRRGEGWSEISQIGSSLAQNFSLYFACSDFRTTQASSP